MMKETKMVVSNDITKVGKLVSHNSHYEKIVGSPISAEYFDGIRKYLNEIGDFFAQEAQAMDLFKNHNLGYAGEMLERFEEREYFNNPLAIEALAVMASLMFIKDYSKKEMVHYDGQIEHFGSKLRKNLHSKENDFVNALSYLWELNHLKEDSYEERAKNVLVALEKGNYVDSLTAFQRTFCRGLMSTFSGENSQKLHALFMDSDIFTNTFNDCGFQEKVFIVTQLASDYEAGKWKKSYWSNASMYQFIVNAWRLAKKNNNNKSDLKSIAEKLGLGNSNYGTLVNLYLYLVDINLFGTFTYNKQNTVFADMFFSLDFFTKRNYIPNKYEHYLIKKEWSARDNAVLNAISVLASSYKGFNFDSTLIQRVKMLLTKAYKYEPYRVHSLFNVPFEFMAYVMNGLFSQLSAFNNVTSFSLENDGFIIPFDNKQEEFLLDNMDSNSEASCIEHCIDKYDLNYRLYIGDIKSFLDISLRIYSNSELLQLENDELPNLLNAIEKVRLWFKESLNSYHQHYYNLLIAHDVHDLDTQTAEGMIKAFDLKLQNCIVSDFEKSLDDVEILKAMELLGEKVYEFIASLHVSSFDNIEDREIQEGWIKLYLETHFEINPFKFPNVMTNVYLHFKEQGIEVDFGNDIDLFFQQVIEMKHQGIIQINQLRSISEYFKTDEQKLDEKISKLEKMIETNHSNGTEKGYTFKDTFKKIVETIEFVQSANGLQESLKRMSLQKLDEHFDKLFREALEHKDIQSMYMYDMYVFLDDITNLLNGEEGLIFWWGLWGLYTQKSAEIRKNNKDLSNRKIAYYDFVRTQVLPLEAQLKEVSNS